MTYTMRPASRPKKKPLSMIIEILTDFDWDELSKTPNWSASFEITNNKYRRQVQTDLAGPSEKIYFSIFRNTRISDF